MRTAENLDFFYLIPKLREDMTKAAEAVAMPSFKAYEYHAQELRHVETLFLLEFPRISLRLDLWRSIRTYIDAELDIAEI
jgi:hypothetical protein